jgi:DNA-directed RNA polymerase subunit K/omega
VVHRPEGSNPFEFIVVSSLRAAQLMRGCRPLVEPGLRVITTAQLEVAAGKIARIVEPPAIVPKPA